MIQIPITEIKTFLNRSSSIKSDTLIPITSFVRIKSDGEKLTFYKSGQNAFIIHSFDYINPIEIDFLVEERAISIACENSKEDFAVFEIEYGSIKISVGSYCQSSASEDLKSFYKFPEFDNHFEMELSSDVLDAINSASKYAYSGKEFVTNRCFVHLFKNSVCATDNMKGFYKKFDEKLPELVLSLNSCSILSRLSSVDIKELDTHFIVRSGSTIYGFQKEQYKSPDFCKVYNTIQEIKRPGFFSKKDSILSFADKSFKLSSGFVDAIEISSLEGRSIKLEFKSDAVKASTVSVIEVDKKEGYCEPDTFLVSANTLKQVLSTLQNEEIDVFFASHSTSKYLIFSESLNHISFIMGMDAA